MLNISTALADPETIMASRAVLAIPREEVLAPAPRTDRRARDLSHRLAHPSPRAIPESPSRAFIFRQPHDAYKGVLVYVGCPRSLRELD